MSYPQLYVAQAVQPAIRGKHLGGEINLFFVRGVPSAEITSTTTLEDATLSSHQSRLEAVHIYLTH